MDMAQVWALELELELEVEQAEVEEMVVPQVVRVTPEPMQRMGKLVCRRDTCAVQPHRALPLESWQEHPKHCHWQDGNDLLSLKSTLRTATVLA
jgi:hypothetical protein